MFIAEKNRDYVFVVNVALLTCGVAQLDGKSPADRVRTIEGSTRNSRRTSPVLSKYRAPGVALQLTSDGDLS